MTPWEIAEPGSESAHQKALFAFCARAERIGFTNAWRPEAYKGGNLLMVVSDDMHGVPELKWLHAIPNGGARNAVTAGRMKAEGVKAGVLDIMLPVRRVVAPDPAKPEQVNIYGGLYIEMKKQGGALSGVQKLFIEHVTANGYRFALCFDWISAAMVVQNYLELDKARAPA